MIEQRTNVFEENPFKFNEAHPLTRGKAVPYGFRAVWPERQRLAMAKLQPKIDTATEDKDFPDILLEKVQAEDGYSDFIEVHVYGQLHPKAFKDVKATVPEDDIDRMIWGRVKDRLAVLDISYDEDGV
jgi:hypothetical protein